MTTSLVARENTTVMQRASTAFTLVEMRERVEALDSFYRGLMQEGTDYGKIPGTDKPTLYQPGAQLACTYFGFAPTFEVLPSSVEDWERGFFALSVRCRLSRGDGSAVAEGIGACNSKEDKYRWRNQDPQCPLCGAFTIRRGAAARGGGYYCAQKGGGCGENFRRESDEAREITRQPAGRIENPEPWSLHNTILKMAEKRALVAATLNATGASRIFTQDVEDLPEMPRAAQDQYQAVEGEIIREEPAEPPVWVSTYHTQWAKGAAKAVEIGATIPEKLEPSEGKTACDARLRELAVNVKGKQARLDLEQELRDVVGIAVDHGAESFEVPENLGEIPDADLREMITSVQQAIPATEAA